MKKIYVFYAILFMAGAALYSLGARADMLELKELNVDAISFFDGGETPLISQNGLTNRTLGDGIDVNIKTDLFRYFYWDSKIESMTDKPTHAGEAAGQFRMIGLEMRLGVRISETLEFGYYHQSIHDIDNQLPYGFPVMDGAELKIRLFQSKTERKTVWGDL